MLYENGIDFNNESESTKWLPLELFDDTTYNDYTNDEWFNKCKDEEGNGRILKAKGLYLNGERYVYAPI